MKYLVHVGETRLEKIEIFCEEDNHAVKAEQLGILDAVIAAGFISFDEDGGVYCGGHSESLTRALDRSIISRGAMDEKVFKFHNRISSRR